MNLYNLGAWAILSGSLFTLFSYLANQYHKQNRSSLQFLQDFIGGVLFMSFIAVLIPDYFPDILNFFSSPTDALKTVSESSSLSISSFSDNSEKSPETSFVNLLPKIGGFMNSIKSNGIDDIQLQLGPIPSGSLGGR
jgi:hypothetical protein